jgi:hypothetical protein
MKKMPKLLVCLLVLAQYRVLGGQSASHLNGLRMRVATPAGQEFFCAGTYTVAECQVQTSFLRAVLQKYDAEKLGKWTWVLIRSDDWIQLVSQLHLDPASPAFSHLEYRQTFLDEALLVRKPKRELELVTKWNIPFDEFLNFAVSHELGHAFCQESDEIKAERFGGRLRKCLPSVCDSKKRNNLLAQVH